MVEQGKLMNETHEIIIYQTQDGKTKIDVRMSSETLWLTQAQMVDLFQTSKQNISLHINNVFSENELSRLATVKEYLTVQKEGAREVKRAVKYYSLDEYGEGTLIGSGKVTHEAALENKQTDRYLLYYTLMHLAIVYIQTPNFCISTLPCGWFRSWR